MLSHLHYASEARERGSGAVTFATGQRKRYKCFHYICQDEQIVCQEF